MLFPPPPEAPLTWTEPRPGGRCHPGSHTITIRPVLGWLCLALALVSSGCGSQPAAITESSGFDVSPREGKLPELLYLAITEIQSRCSELGSVLLDMYDNGSLAWGTLAPRIMGWHTSGVGKAPGLSP